MPGNYCDYYKMKALVLIVLVAVFPTAFPAAAPACSVSPSLLAMLRTKYSHENERDLKEEGRVEHLSIVTAGTLVLIRDNNDPDQFGQYLVEAYEGAENLGGTFCAGDASWVHAHWPSSPTMARRRGL